MSKINLVKNGKIIDKIENKLEELNNFKVMVSVENIKELEKYNIPYCKFPKDFYLVKRGKKKKKFNEEDVLNIKKDLQKGLSIRKCSDKYKCSTNTIQLIKKGEY